ncbi:MAG TPA: sulfurtransferase TusA family protein [Candidatus Krumholzibacteria bacterium]|nr:sulfurtransferase TusA family protein [Candidatus Krumholzibacteria bacterium]
MDRELRINARGLSEPGPRLMVETALEKNRPDFLRVVVSGRAAAEDVGRFLEQAGAVVDIDAVGDEIHVLARFQPGPGSRTG